MSAILARRGFLAGLACLPSVAAPALDRPRAEPSAHPDRALLDAEIEVERLSASYATAKVRSERAHEELKARVGPCPDALWLTPEEEYLFAGIVPLRTGGRLRLRTFLREWRTIVTWTDDALREVIAEAPARLGRGGQTPHRIRRWRAILPLAAEREERIRRVSAELRFAELCRARDEADKALTAARTRLSMLPASTLDGLAVRMRRVRDVSWEQFGPDLIGILECAAVLCGVPPHDPHPDFDPERWAAAVHRIGGRLRWNPTTAECWVDWPRLPSGAPQDDEDVRTLRVALQSNTHKVRTWLWHGGLS